jgi:hypothetical protein
LKFFENFFFNLLFYFLLLLLFLKSISFKGILSAYGMGLADVVCEEQRPSHLTLSDDAEKCYLGLMPNIKRYCFSRI